MTESTKKPGRPPKHDAPMSAALRVKQFRERAREAALVAGENTSTANTAALLAGLARQIKLIDTDADHAPVARDVASQLIKELCERYEIDIS